MIDLPFADEISQRLEPLDDRRRLVPAVAVVEVQVVGAEAIEGALELRSHVLATESVIVRPGFSSSVEGIPNLRRDDEILAIVVLKLLAEIYCVPCSRPSCA